MSDEVSSKRTTVLHAIADVVGMDVALTLARVLDDQRIYVPVECGDDHPIVQAVGHATAALISQYFHSTYLVLPSTRNDERMLAMRAGKMTPREIAQAVGITERQVHAILTHAKQDQAAAPS